MPNKKPTDDLEPWTTAVFYVRTVFERALELHIDSS